MAFCHLKRHHTSVKGVSATVAPLKLPYPGRVSGWNVLFAGLICLLPKGIDLVLGLKKICCIVEVVVAYNVAKTGSYTTLSMQKKVRSGAGTW